MSHDHREAIAEMLAAHGVGQVVPLGHGGWDVRDVPPDVIDALLGSDVLTQIRAEARAEAERVRDHWRKVAEQRGEDMNNALTESQRNLEGWMSADRRATEARAEALREAADLVSQELAEHLIASTRAPASGPLFRVEQRLRAALTAEGSA